MFTSWPGSQNQTVIYSKFRRDFQFAAPRVPFNKALQALKGTLDDCEQTFSKQQISIGSMFISSKSLLNSMIRLTLTL